MMPDKIQLHPEFAGSSADVTLVAGSVGFRVNRAMLSMASPALAKLVRASDLSGGVVDTGDEAGELYAFLKLMRLGPSRTTPPPGAGAADEDKENKPIKPERKEGKGKEREKREEKDEGEKDMEREKEGKGKGKGKEKEKDGREKDEAKEPLAASTAPNAPNAPPIRPKILVSRPGTGVKALDRALRDAQAKVAVKKKKSRVRFQDPAAPPPLPLPPSHPFHPGAAPPRPRSNSASASASSPSPSPAHSPSAPARALPSTPTSPPSSAPPSPSKSSSRSSAKSVSKGPPPPAAAGPPPPFAPSIGQLLQIHGLARKYPGFYTQALLDFHIELNAPALLASLGPAPSQLELFNLLQLTHTLRSSKLWSLVLGRLAQDQHWRAALDPWSFGELEAKALGQDLFSILGILGAIHMDTPAGAEHGGHGGKGKRKKDEAQAGGAFAQVDKVCIMYDEGELRKIGES